MNSPGASAPVNSIHSGNIKYALVALDRPLSEDLTYRIDNNLFVSPGMRVVVPLGKREEIGVVTSITNDPGCDPARVRPIFRILDKEPLIDGELLELSSQIAREWACSRGQALAAMMPAPLRRESERKTELIAILQRTDFDTIPDFELKEPDRYRVLRTLREAGGEMPASELCRTTKLSASPVKTLAKRGFVKLEKRRAVSDPLLKIRGVNKTTPPELTGEQREAVEAISSAASGRAFELSLLFGITGSGKTEVYLRALDATLKSGRGGIVLVPEISLTPQTVERFRSRFDNVSVLHSRLTDAERIDEWRRIRSGESRIVVGARSAVFAPIADLGIIIIDEEHEPSFKQSAAPRYHARDVAILRGKLNKAAVVLGSATPSLETWHRALDGRVRLLKLTKRLGGGALPPVRIADLRKDRAREIKTGAGVSMTLPLKLAIEKALAKKERVILFLNRRGYAPVLWCSACGQTVQCSRCAVSLTFHRKIEKLVCHMCAREAMLPAACPNCKESRPRLLGAGTERIEQLVWKNFPKAHVARMDSDTTVARGSHEAILDKFNKGEIDILVGTQMIAKGLDVPEVTVVGVVDADAALHIPEFNSSERTFQLVAQVAGRAGRSAAGGEVFVQTSMPDHPAIIYAARHDFESYAKLELVQRRQYRYPPFVRLVRVLVEDAREQKVKDAITQLAERFSSFSAKGVELLGPQPAPIARIKGEYRYHLLLRCDPPEAIEGIRGLLLDVALKTTGGLRATVDVDPASTM
ncbi:MAG: primosomal protein N' [Planctomycetota bacterium]